jgi:pilus assembly protein Flp/PilA
MKNIFAKLSVVIKSLGRVEGQDLVEYALVVALIAFAATAGMKTLASNINTAFTNIGTSLTTQVT